MWQKPWAQLTDHYRQDQGTITSVLSNGASGVEEWRLRGKTQRGLFDFSLFPPLDKNEIPVLENKILPHKKKTVKIYFCCNVIKGKITLNIRK